MQLRIQAGACTYGVTYATKRTTDGSRLNYPWAPAPTARRIIGPRASGIRHPSSRFLVAKIAGRLGATRLRLSGGTTRSEHQPDVTLDSDSDSDSERCRNQMPVPRRGSRLPQQRRVRLREPHQARRQREAWNRGAAALGPLRRSGLKPNRQLAIRASAPLDVRSARPWGLVPRVLRRVGRRPLMRRSRVGEKALDPQRTRACRARPCDERGPSRPGGGDRFARFRV